MSSHLIYLDSLSGHRPTYVDYLIAGAKEQGDRVSLAVPAADLHLLPEAAHEATIIELPGKLASSRQLSDLARSIEVDTVIAPDGDRWVRSLAKRPRWNAEATLVLLIMRPKGQKAGTRVRQSFDTLLKTGAIAVSRLVPRVRVVVLRSSIDQPVRHHRSVRDPIVLDPPTVSPSEDLSLTRDPDRMRFGVLGAITLRKNVGTVAAALTALPDQTELAVVGRWEEDAWAQAQPALSSYQAAGGKLTIVNRRLTDEELDWAIVNTDCIVMAHSNEGASGILGKAAAAGKLIMAAGAQSLRADVITLGPPHVWSPLNVSSMTAAARSAIEGRQRQPAQAADVGSPTEFARTLLG